MRYPVDYWIEVSAPGLLLGNGDGWAAQAPNGTDPHGFRGTGRAAARPSGTRGAGRSNEVGGLAVRARIISLRFLGGLKNRDGIWLFRQGGFIVGFHPSEDNELRVIRNQFHKGKRMVDD